jgi:hypothetical protein
MALQVIGLGGGVDASSPAGSLWYVHAECLFVAISVSTVEREGGCVADGFLVDLEALERAAAGVDGTLDEVSQQEVSAIPVDETSLGHELLAATLTDFRSRWQLGVNNLVKDGREIAARLTVNVMMYRKAEQDTIDRLNHGVLTGPSTDPGMP